MDNLNRMKFNKAFSNTAALSDFNDVTKQKKDRLLVRRFLDVCSMSARYLLNRVNEVLATLQNNAAAA